ncbi:MAG TPA: hypothetical protein VFE51_11060 [Verrucomicrobiae bacterium]|nr:hypothetical protein [Verrucomicrobiae bacterium]
MKSLVIGPFFSSMHVAAIDCGQVVPLGLQLEWASADSAAGIPVFRSSSGDGLDRLTIERVVLELRQLPFHLQCARCHLVETSSGRFLPLPSLLVALYSEYEVARSIFDVLAELGGLVPLEHPGRPLAANSGLLIPEAEQQGFVLSTIVADETDVYAEIGWRPPQQNYVFHTCICAFHQDKAGSAGTGQWRQAGQIGVGQLLSQELRRIVPGPPSWLLSRAGTEHLKNRIHSPVTFSR